MFREEFLYDRSGNLSKHLSYIYHENRQEKEIGVERTFLIPLGEFLKRWKVVKRKPPTHMTIGET